MVVAGSPICGCLVNSSANATILTTACEQEDSRQSDPSRPTASQRHLEMSFGRKAERFTSKQWRSTATEIPPPHLLGEKRSKTAELTFIVVFPPRLSWKLDRKWCSRSVDCLPVKTKRWFEWRWENGKGGDYTVLILDFCKNFTIVWLCCLS